MCDGETALGYAWWPENNRVLVHARSSGVLALPVTCQTPGDFVWCGVGAERVEPPTILAGIDQLTATPDNGPSRLFFLPGRQCKVQGIVTIKSSELQVAAAGCYAWDQGTRAHSTQRCLLLPFLRRVSNVVVHIHRTLKHNGRCAGVYPQAQAQ